MNSIDSILKEFGGDATNISINFVDGKWCMDYNGLHLERDENISVCADNMLSWYREKHTYKRAAEEMWIALELLSNEDDTKVKKICELRNEYITKDEEGNLVWNPAYRSTSTLKISSNVKTAKEETNVVKTAEQPVKNISERDEYPDYFIIQKDDIYTTTDCWGYDVNGERTHVVVNRVSPKMCVIENRKPNLTENVQTLQINESEYNDYYDEACRLISANL